MNRKTEDILTILGLLLVLFFAMLDLRVSVILAIILIIIYVVRQFQNPRK